MKKNQCITIILMVALLAIFGCKNPEANATDNAVEKFDLAAAKTSIEARSKIFAEALNKKDSVGLANCYTNDGKFMQPNDKTVSGRENIQKLFGQWMKSGMPQFSIKTIEVWGDENVLAAEEEWTFSDKDGKVVDTGKSIEVFKMEDGVWKLHRDCYNSDFPCPK
ncbi:nuclear transport factor 2 family protein [Flavobacterium sp.]|uniref:YybH family protein n=1 Tax=Flavobacterium sp. TaxID=239 RepID=UPI00260C2C4D|nr:nuclear transport factor 2 family protein [Flavobacterium sp.]